MAKITIDNDGNKWPGTATIADLAQFTPLLACSSGDLDIYMVQEAMEEEWPFEIDSFQYEYGHGYQAEFADGSIIYVGAWAYRDEPVAHCMYQAWKRAHQ